MEIDKINNLFSSLDITNWELAYNLLCSNKSKRDVDNEVFFQIVSKYSNVDVLFKKDVFNIITKFIKSNLSKEHYLHWEAIYHQRLSGMTTAGSKKILINYSPTTSENTTCTDNIIYKWKLDGK